MNKKQFSEQFNLINQLLMDWNPLGVDGPILNEEYISIIPTLLKFENDKNRIKEFLKTTLDKRYGVNYTQSELNIIVHKICSIK